MKSNKKLTNIVLYIALLAIMTVGVSAAQTAVDLGTAGDFVILTESGISTTGATSIVGDIGVSPIDGTAITGFGLIMDSSNEFATSSIVTGNAYAADYAPPTPTRMTTAISDMKTAYTDAAGRSDPTATELGAGNIDGMTIAPGLYKWGTGVAVPTGVTLSGGANDVWVFQIAQDLTVGNGAIITLSDGAQAKNIFWQVAGQATLGTTADFKGIILSKTAISMNTGVKMNGRALAQTAVTLDAVAITGPTASSTSTPTPTPPRDTESDETPSTDENPSADWECEEWSGCSSDGIRTQTCKQGEVTSTQEESCTPRRAPVVETERDSPVIEDEEVDRAPNGEAGEREEAIRPGKYTTSAGESLTVTAVAENLNELRVNGATAQTDLHIIAKTDAEGKTTFTVLLRNGQEKEILIMPESALQNALEMLGVGVCSAENNCTMRLKDVGTGNAERILYEVELDRSSKILGIFHKNMRVRAEVDAETGKVTVDKPWWAFMATEPKEV